MKQQINRVWFLFGAIIATLVISACGSGEKPNDDQQRTLNDAQRDLSKNDYALGGQVIGLKGTLVLTSSGNNREVKENGSFIIAPSVLVGSDYSVTIKSQPAGQTCVLQNDRGVIRRSDTNWVVVVCADESEVNKPIVVKGRVSNLLGPITITTSSGKSFTILTEGDYIQKFDAGIATVLPISIASNSADLQTCELASDIQQNDNVYIVNISCRKKVTEVAAKVRISGLSETLTLRLNNDSNDEITSSTSGDFTFKTIIKVGSAYSISKVNETNNQICNLVSPTGNAKDIDVVVLVQCGPPNGAGLTARAKPWDTKARIEWNDVGAYRYNIHYTTDRTKDFQSAETVIANVSSPYDITNLANGKIHYVYVEAEFPGFSSLQNKMGVKPNFVEFNDAINTISAAPNGSVYVGGSFNAYGMRVEGAAVIDTAAVNTSDFLPAVAPKVEGTINKVVSDGRGGWYIGGDFTRIDNVNKRYVAHIFSDGALDPNWNVTVDNTVTTLLLNRNVLYIGGLFKTINSAPRNYLAAVDDTGKVLPYDAQIVEAVSPEIFKVSALSISNNRLFIGGLFSRGLKNVTSCLCRNLAATDLLKGAAENVNVWTNSTVNALASSGNTLYVGGEFTIVNDLTRSYLAAVDATTGNLSATFQATTNSIVYALAANESSVYVGGQFYFSKQNANAADIYTPYFARFNASGVVTVPTLRPNRTVKDVQINANDIYVSGQFDMIDQTPRNKVAVYDASLQLRNWNPPLDVGYEICTLAFNGSTTFLAGNSLYQIGQIEQSLVAAFDSSGKLTNWNPGIDPIVNGEGPMSAYVNAITTIGDRIYMGGFFDYVSGVYAPSLAVINNDSSRVTSYTDLPNSYGDVVSITADTSGTIYLGGSFYTPREYFASYDFNGAVRDWSIPGYANSDTVVYSAFDKIYVGGDFNLVGDDTIPDNLIAVGSDGTIDGGFSPISSGYVRDMKNSNGILYVGGNFTSVNGGNYSHLFAIDKDHKFRNVVPTVDGSVNAIGVFNNTIYIGGYFMDVGGSTRDALAAFDQLGRVVPWNPILTGPEGADIQNIAVTSNAVWFSGYFNSVNGVDRYDFAAVDHSGDLLNWPIFPAPWEFENVGLDTVGR